VRIPYRLKCIDCKKEHLVFADLNAESIEFRCCERSQTIPPYPIKGIKILERAVFEYNETKDYPLSIVFSAAAFECELADLHHRWLWIKGLWTKQIPTDEELDKKLRKHSDIKSRIEAVARLMGHTGIDEFVKSDSKLTEIVKNGFPSIKIGTVARDFQTNLFWPRNRILHVGYTGYTSDDAKKCINIAQLGIGFVQAMNDAKAKENQDPSAKAGPVTAITPAQLQQPA